ncbi:MAG: ABC transporter ATP-binding protein [Williamsoniiplasma luminosum]|uniref:ABC transporter ATP-binding protein n=1 Tax=Williamsoniiplasma luminosum TaxID=214888 RepID=A0A2S0NKL4_9MOLU|nr:ABC transporter ATP-binding protein [Williamsoniiplasma luminosum]AVP49545.1 MAG: ABC transporter ATP-binding protein [Williamsoniiplasma luminosum]
MPEELKQPKSTKSKLPKEPKIDKLVKEPKADKLAKEPKTPEILEQPNVVSKDASEPASLNKKQLIKKVEKLQHKVNGLKQKKNPNSEELDLAQNELDLAKKELNSHERQFVVVPDHKEFEDGVKGLKLQQKNQKQLTSRYSKEILEGNIVSTTGHKPDIKKHSIELKNVKKSYITGDLETPVLKGIDIKLDQGDFIVILGPSGSGKTTFLNIISGLDKATSGDVFVLGSNLTLLKDSHLTKFRRKNVGFIFQQYNLLTNLTAKENAEVGENLSTNKNENFTIEKIFETIGMTEQLNKYPHQMSGGQQQRVSIARALTKNPSILFADEPTGALDEEMGRKVLDILVKVNKEFKTTIVVVTHNPNIAKIGNTIIHIKNGLIDELIHNPNPADPSTIDWS